MNVETIKLINDVISILFCYNDGCYDQAELIERLKGLNLPNEVIEHVKDILIVHYPDPDWEEDTTWKEDGVNPVTGEKL